MISIIRAFHGVIMHIQPNQSLSLATEAGERSETAGGGKDRRRRKPASSPHAKATRRSFNVTYKTKILQETDQATQEGQILYILRREGLYTSHLSRWRKWRERMENGGMASADNSSSDKKNSAGSMRMELRKLRNQNAQLQKKLDQANLCIELQKKLGMMIENSNPEEENNMP